ncbi:MAG: cell division protein ZapA [Psittacicella sp.]
MAKQVDVKILGLIIRMACQEGEEEEIISLGKDLEKKVIDLKARSNILQLDKLLSVVAINLLAELRHKEKTQAISPEFVRNFIGILEDLNSNAQ